MKLETLQDLYVEELKDLYSAENQILKALPQMVKGATAPELKAGFEEHLNQTREHVSRLEQIFEGLGKSPRGKHCKGMEGVLEEGKELLKEEAEPEVMDAAFRVVLHVAALRVDDDEAHDAVGKPDRRRRLAHAFHLERLLVELCGLLDVFDDHRDVAKLCHGTSVGWVERQQLCAREMLL